MEVEGRVLKALNSVQSFGKLAGDVYKRQTEGSRHQALDTRHLVVDSD